RAASKIIVEAPLDAVDYDRLFSRSIARGYAPTVLAIAFEFQRIALGVFPLHVRGAAAVLEVINAFLAHVFVLDLPEIEPDVRKLMNEKRSRIHILPSINLFPVESLGPGGVALLRQRMS